MGEFGAEGNGTERGIKRAWSNTYTRSQQNMHTIHVQIEVVELRQQRRVADSLVDEREPFRQPSIKFRDAPVVSNNTVY